MTNWGGLGVNQHTYEYITWKSISVLIISLRKEKGKGWRWFYDKQKWRKKLVFYLRYIFSIPWWHSAFDFICRLMFCWCVGEENSSWSNAARIPFRFGFKPKRPLKLFQIFLKINLTVYFWIHSLELNFLESVFHRK